MTESVFWLTGLTFSDGTKGALAIGGSRIAALAASAPSGVQRSDFSGWLCVPPLVEGHCHLDKTFLGAPWQPYSGPPGVASRIAVEKKIRSRLDIPVQIRGAALLDKAIASGTGLLRTHVDIDPDWKLTNLEAVLGLREAYADRITIQVVAFPQSGILNAPGTSKLLDAALSEGADLIGGLDPATIDGDRDAHLDTVFALAEKRGAGIDIHLHEVGVEGLASLTAIAERARVLGMGGSVTVSHAFVLSELDEPALSRMADLLADAGVTILSSAPPRFMPPLMTLAGRGVGVGLGSDNIRDAWSPFGNADMLDRASIAARQNGWATDEELGFALELVTTRTADLLGQPGRDLIAGAPANFVLLQAPSVALAVAAPPRNRLVFRNGRPVAGPVLDFNGDLP